MEIANKPMTLEQLKQMNGRPVWAQLLEPTRGQKEGWVIVYKDNGYAAVQRWERDPLWYQEYGKTWLAYAQQPAADVRPVVLGRCEIVAGSDGKEYMVCSECRVQQTLTGTFSYCPNCGADMRGGGEENEAN